MNSTRLSSFPRAQLALALLAVLAAMTSVAGAAPDAPVVGTAVIGKPLVLKFKATDGREVDLAKLKGKVVLVDFWATWCGPCLRELPTLKAAYTRMRDKGFEIIGVSFDRQAEALSRVVKRENLEWPQYFETAKLGHRIGDKLKIESIPTLWLIDRKGNLCDLDVSHDLVARVEKLLAEK